jgi:hypothetical protein
MEETLNLEGRIRLWMGKIWGWGDIDNKMTYIGLISEDSPR